MLTLILHSYIVYLEIQYGIWKSNAGKCISWHFGPWNFDIRRMKKTAILYCQNYVTQRKTKQHFNKTNVCKQKVDWYFFAGANKPGKYFHLTACKLELRHVLERLDQQHFFSSLLALILHSYLETQYGGQQIILYVLSCHLQQDLLKKTVSNVAFPN